MSSMPSPRRILMWALVGVFVVSLGRWIAYALAAGTLAQKLSSQGAGARPAVVAVFSLGAALAATATGLWLVAVGLRERSRLELNGWAASGHPFSARRLLARSAALSAVTIVVFTTVESLIHYQDGLGFHGWHCIAGPVHQNAAPIMIALSLMAAAVVTAVDAVLAAARRVVARLVLTARALPRAGAAWFDPRPAPLRGCALHAIAPTRGPPLPA
ncbi:MAG TPA: hypothetical protein VM684_01195 [Gaiellales bacterium]|nr:hypothetical protein [Gaiellales bacterium]